MYPSGLPFCVSAKYKKVVMGAEAELNKINNELGGLRHHPSHIVQSVKFQLRVPWWQPSISSESSFFLHLENVAVPFLAGGGNMCSLAQVVCWARKDPIAGSILPQISRSSSRVLGRAICMASNNSKAVQVERRT